MNKKSLMIVIIILILILGGIFLKMKYDEKKYYDEQKERIIIYMKYNVKGFKEIQFEEQKENPLDGFVITGYINNDKTNIFWAHMWSEDNYQFEYISSYSDKLDRMMIKDEKTVSELKKKINKKDEN